MLILGIDTSCDDTSASVVEDGSKIISNIVSNQTDIHKKYGGIVPELASRKHTEMIIPVVDEALKKAGISINELSAISVCYGPGLIGSLLVGCSFAKALCYSKDLPLVAVNHLEGHILSAFLENPALEFPFLSLVVSGGHTSIYSVNDYGIYAELGRTRDDAAGEAYDKVSKLLGLGYPGGPVIDTLAKNGDPTAIDFPRAYLPETLDFSFSGLKTSVLHYLRAEARIRKSSEAIEIKTSELHNFVSSGLVNNIAASFQSSVVDVLVRKTEWAIKQQGIKRVTVSGGVAANSELRYKMKAMGEIQAVEVYFPSAGLCTDNAAMIAAAGYHRFLKNETAGPGLNPQAYLPL